jgi:hypothetical protein
LSEQVTAIELRRALMGTLESLAPRGSARSIANNLFCDTLVDLMADMLAFIGIGTFVWFGKKFALSDSRWAHGRHGQHLQEG